MKEQLIKELVKTSKNAEQVNRHYAHKIEALEKVGKLSDCQKNGLSKLIKEISLMTCSWVGLPTQSYNQHAVFWLISCQIIAEVCSFGIGCPQVDWVQRFCCSKLTKSLLKSSLSESVSDYTIIYLLAVKYA